MKRFLISLSSLFVSSSFVCVLIKESQLQTYELTTASPRFDDFFLKDDWQQPIKSFDEIAWTFSPTQRDKTCRFLKSQTNLELKEEQAIKIEQDILKPINFINLEQNQPFSNLYVLGDSLSDIGGLVKFTSGLINMPYPLYNNSFTDGDVAVKVLANKLSLPQKTGWRKHSWIAKKLFEDDDINYEMNKFICQAFCEEKQCKGKCNEVCTSICNKLLYEQELPYRNNYAVGGARASLGTDKIAKNFYNYFSLEEQVNLLLSDHKIKSTDLIYLGIGGNDLMAAVKEKSYFAAMEILTQTLVAIENSVNRLIENNARHIIIANAPNIAKTPRFLKHSHDYAWQISGKYSELFEKMYTKLEKKHSNYLKKFDLYSSFNKILCEFEDEGINIVSGCVDVKYSFDFLSNITSVIETIFDMKWPLFDPQFSFQCDQTSLKKYFFFDEIHPTAIVHKAVGEQLYKLATSKW